MTKVQTAWLAGLLEGEGCFFLANGNSPGIQLKMTDRDVVERAHELMRGQFRQERMRPDRPKWSQLWSASVFGNRCIEVMNDVLPYMGTRRSEKIREIFTTREANKAATKIKRDKWAEGFRQYWTNPDHRAAQSKRLMAWWSKHPELKEEMRKRMSRASTERWARHRAAADHS